MPISIKGIINKILVSVACSFIGLLLTSLIVFRQTSNVDLVDIMPIAFLYFFPFFFLTVFITGVSLFYFLKSVREMLQKRLSLCVLLAILLVLLTVPIYTNIKDDYDTLAFFALLVSYLLSMILYLRLTRKSLD